MGTNWDHRLLALAQHVAPTAITSGNGKTNMTDDGDRVDPARTELTRQRSLDKAKDRRVIMTDMTERLRDNAPMGEQSAIRNLMYDAAEEIERLRSVIMGICISNMELIDKNEELRGEIFHLRFPDSAED